MSSQPPQPPPASQAQRTAEAKKAFTASLNNVGSSLDTELQSTARNIHSNSKALDRQEKDVEKEIKKLSKQSDAMQKVVDKTNRDLREFDFHSFEASIGADLERDLMLIEETLRIVEEDERCGASDQEQEDHIDSEHGKPSGT